MRYPQRAPSNPGMPPASMPTGGGWRGILTRLAPYKKHTPFLLIFILALNLLTINFTLPWHSTNEDNGLVFETIAINHIRFGLGVTKGQDLRDEEAPSTANRVGVPGYPGEQQFEFLVHGPVTPFVYGDHPPALGLSIAAGFELLGYHFWVVRAVPILYTLAGLVAFYLLMLYLFDLGTAIFASLLYAGFPMFAYYGRDVAHEAPTLFWALLLLTGYFHYLRDPRRRWLALMAGSIVIGGFYGWPMFYFAAILFAVHWIAERRLDLRFALATALPAVVTFGLVVGQILWARNSGVGSLVSLFSLRSAGNDVHSSDMALFPWLAHLGHFQELTYGHWAQVLIPFASAWVIWRGIHERFTPRVRLALMLFLFGLSHVLIFREGALIHPYWQFYFLPFYAMVFGWAGITLARRNLHLPWQRAAALTAVGLLALALNWSNIYMFYTTHYTPFVPLVMRLLR